MADGYDLVPRLARIGPAPQLLPVPMVTPGTLGVNLQQSSSVLPPQWAYDAVNAVIDSNYRIAARKGVTNVTTTPISGSPAVKSIFEQHSADGTASTIIAWNGGISTSVTNPSGSDISGSVTDTNGRWQFVNFNSKAIGFQSGQKLIVRTTGNFATVVESSGTAPTGGIGTAAYGRVWQLDADGHTVKYCALLNETAWDPAGGSAGQFDMANVWTQGTDVVTAIIAFNHNIVVFGLRHIVFWSDGGGSALGLDPSKMGVVDVIEGTGCVSQWTLQAVGQTDLLFLSPTGVQSLGRLLVNRSRPVATLTKYVRDTLVGQLAEEDTTLVTAAYSKTQGFYLLSFPVAKTTWIVDLRRIYQDQDGDAVGAVTYWNYAPTAVLETTARTLYLAKSGGKVGMYAGTTDEGSSYHYLFSTPWLDLGQDYAQRLKILKRLTAIIYVRNQTNIAFKWYIDFDTNGQADSVTSVGATSAEWGSAEYGVAEWSGGLLLQLLHVNANGTGQYFRFSIEADVTTDFAIQQTGIFAKIGRMAS